MDDAWELFWAGSGLTPATTARFGERIAAFGDGGVPERLCTYPAADVALHRPRDRLARLMDRRRSSRSFAPGTLSVRQLAGLLSPLAARPDGTRAHPSAGGLYPLEVFALLGDVGGDLAGTVACYNPDNHSLTPVTARPAWPAWSGSINLPVDGEPQVVLVFVLLTDRVVEKYGATGGRFALFEVGHAAQNIALRVAADGLAGCLAGGVVESQLLAMLRLDGTPARVALAYACGLPASP